MAQPSTQTLGALRKIVPSETLLVLLAGAAIILVLLAHLLFLTDYPPVFIDEAWFTDATWNWAKTGVHFETMHAGVLDQFGYEWMNRYSVGEAPWLVAFSLLGFGLFQARLVSWILGVALVVLVVIVGRRLYGTMTGIIGGLLLSLSPPFVQASHFARQDILLAAVLAAAFLLALWALDTNRAWAHLLTGFLVGVSLTIHQNGILFAPALALLYLVYYGRTFYRKRGVWLVGVGGALGILVFFVFHILPSPETYSKLWGVYFTGEGEHQLPLLNPTALPGSLFGEFGRYHFYDNALDFGLIGAALAFLAFRRSPADRKLVAFAGGGLLSFVLFAGNKSDLYAILLYPFLLVMVAETLTTLMREAAAFSRQQLFAGALLVLFVGNSAIHYLRPAFQNRDYDYYAITEQIASVAPPDARILGLPTWWIGLSDYDYRSSLSLTFYQYFNDYSLTEALEVIRPDIVIFDGALSGLLVDEGETLDIAQDLYKLPREEFRTFLAERGEKVLEFTDRVHGPFEIYAIHWDSESANS